jgi:guanine deaminase
MSPDQEHNLHQKFLLESLAVAKESLENGGGPFGALVVKGNEIIARGNNLVSSTCDPTAHAEVVAIRRACETLEHFQLEDCVIYSSCEPCPMCLGAIYWARPKALYFAMDRAQAAQMGFDDAFIYEQIPLETHQRSLPTKHFRLPEAEQLVKAWNDKLDKTPY